MIRLLNNRGFGMLQAVFTLALASVPIIASLTLNSYLNKRGHEMGTIAAVDFTRQNLLTLINDDASLMRTIQNNASMACLRGTGQTCQVYTLYPIDLWARTGAAPYYAPAASGTAGFTTRGASCANFPSATCPFRYTLEYAAVNNANYPIFVIFMRLQTAQGTDGAQLGIINPLLYSSAPPPTEWPPQTPGVLPLGGIIKQAHP